MNRCELLEKLFPTMKTLKDGNETNDSGEEAQTTEE